MTKGLIDVCLLIFLFSIYSFVERVLVNMNNYGGYIVMDNDYRGLARQIGRIWSLLVRYFGTEYIYQQNAIKISGKKQDYWFIIKQDEYVETSMVFVYSARKDEKYDDLYMEEYITSFRLGRMNCLNLHEIIATDMEHLSYDAEIFVHDLFIDLEYILQSLRSFKDYNQYASEFLIPYSKDNKRFLKITCYHFS